jgi:hypothetical protein
LLFALAPVVAPVPCFAQNDDTITQEVRARFREGVDLFDQGRFEAARAKFRQAYALKPLPDILYNLAWSSLKSGHPVDAEKEFVKYLREAKDIEQSQKDETNKGLAEARSRNGHIEIAAPAGADIFVDGERAGTSPISDPVPVDPGAHVVKFAPSDAAPQSQSVSVLAGQTATARFGGASSAPPPGPTAPPTTEPSNPPPSSSASSSPSAPTSGGSEPQSEPSSPPASTSAGGAEHVTSSGHSIFAPPANMAPVIIGGTVTLAGIVTAIVMLAVKNNAQDNANSVAAQITAHGGHNGTCTNPSTEFAKACSTLQDDVNAVNTDATVGNIAIAVAGVAFVATAAYWLLGSKGDEGTATRTASGSTWVAPVVTAHQGGLAVGGSF